MGKKVHVIGDIRRINRSKFKLGLVNNTSPYLKSFSGAKIDDFGYYVTPSLLNEKPEICILHIGSNDINFKSLQSNNIKQRAVQLMEIGKKCIASGVEHIIISSVLLKRNNKLTNAISEFNTMIHDMCSENGFHFIGHEKCVD